MRYITSGSIILSLTSTVLAALRASVPCYDTSVPDKYHTACTATNYLGASDSWRTTPNALFTCDGNVAGIYWNTLQGLGLATCVCGYTSSDGINWYYQVEFGVCNGACRASTFTCDGTTPIASSAGGQTSSGTVISPTSIGPVVSSTSTRPSVAVSSSAASTRSGPDGVFPFLVALAFTVWAI